VALQRRHRPADRRIVNNLQTNGTLLDDAWCEFLRAEGFLVGLSLDGPRRLHDRYRSGKEGRGSHDAAMRGFDLLQRHQVPVEILCVVNSSNVQYPLVVYHFFKGIGARLITFLPLVERRSGTPEGVSRRSVPAEAFGEFLCSVFDEWKRSDIETIRVQIFEETARVAFGQEHALCVLRETCGDVPAVEHNGDFYSCDHFVDPHHRLGNIMRTSLAELLDSPAQRAFGEAKRSTLPGLCRDCVVLDMCNGGCPKDRFLTTSDGEFGLNYLCAGYLRFFTHSRPFVRELARLAGTPLPG
jgi:uncharacterized protein